MAFQAIPGSGSGSGSGSSSGFQFLNSPFGDTTYTKVFVGGLAWETKSESLRRYFEQFGHPRLASPYFGSVQGPRGAYVGNPNYHQPVPYGYQQGYLYPPYGYMTYRPEYMYPQNIYPPYTGQQYVQMYNISGTTNPTAYPFGQFSGQPFPSGHGYTTVQGYTMPSHHVVQFRGANVEGVTTAHLTAAQGQQPAGVAAAPISAQPQFIVPARSPQVMQGSGSDQMAG